MALVTNISSNTIVITASKTERGHFGSNFEQKMAASAQKTIPDDIMKLQRMQDLVAERGAVQGIEFDVKTRRYIFDSYSPLGKEHMTKEEMYDRLDEPAEKVPQLRF